MKSCSESSEARSEQAIVTSIWSKNRGMMVLVWIKARTWTLRRDKIWRICCVALVDSVQGLPWFDRYTLLMHTYVLELSVTSFP